MVRSTANKHVKRSPGIESPVCPNPPEHFVLKHQYFNMQDHPVSRKEGTTGGDASAQARQACQDSRGVVPMQRCLDCRARSLVQDPSLAVCQTMCCRQDERRGNIYELVQAKIPNVRQPRMPHAITTRKSHIWHHADCHGQWKRVTYSVVLLRT